MGDQPPCPDRLKQYTEQQIQSAFLEVYNPRYVNQQVRSSKSIFAKAFTVLTGQNDSSIDENSYLQKMWQNKYREQIHKRKTTKANKMSFKKRKDSQTKQQAIEIKEQARLMVLEARSQVIQKKVADKLAKKNGTPKNHNNANPRNGHPEEKQSSSALNNLSPINCDDFQSNSNQINSSSGVRINSSKNCEGSPKTNSGRRFSLRRCYDFICESVLIPSFKRICISPTRNSSNILLPSQFNGFAYVNTRTNTQTQTSQLVMGTPDNDQFLYNEAENLQKQHDDTKRLIALYTTKIYTFPTHECPICNRMLYHYSHNKKNIAMDDQLRCEFYKFGCTDFDDLEKIQVCSKCHYHLKKKKIPPQAYFNNVTPPEAPECINNLTDIELRIISQVKPHMRIFHLCKGRGQAAIKGSCIHFPQKIEEVIEQLPLKTNNNDMIIVNESGHVTNREYQVRPTLIREALIWLKVNNPLYSNIEIQDVSEDEIQLHQINSTNNQLTTFDVPANQNVPNHSTGFKTMPHNREILRSSKSQADYLDAANQCTAMSAVAVAYAYYQNPETWTTHTIDDVLDHGNAYYKFIRDRQRERRPLDDNPVFDALEMEGQIELFGRVNVVFVVEGDAILGGFNKWPDISFPEYYSRLTVALTTFLDSDTTAAIFTARGYSVAVIKKGSSVYLFDSHPRTERGRKGYGIECRGQSKKACIIKYTNTQAGEQISEILHHNFQPTESFHEDPGNSSFVHNVYHDFSFSLQPVTTLILDEQPNDDVQNAEPVLPENNNPEHNKENELETDRQYNHSEGFGNRIMVDSVIQADDYVEPDVDEFRDQVRNNDRVNLQRERGRPLYADKHRRLEELSFVKCFPTGQNGKNEDRIAKITTLDYFQRRIMGSDPRFKTNEYLFYALAEIDKAAVNSKIAVCGKMRKQGQGIDENDRENPGIIDKNTAHTIMVAVRGTSSYWKKYSGDVVAMIAQLGSPHIFLTISYDDLNSKDALTAIWKAKYGPEAEPPDNLSYAERRDLLNENPVAAARHFCVRIGALITMLKTECENIFGKRMADFTYRVEFQDRGSAHIHMIIWLVDMPLWNTPEGLKFIDDNISCSLNVLFRELVERFQSHKHTSTCFKRNKNICRFEFPKVPCNVTRLFNEEEIEKNGGRFFEIRRSENEAHINNYHPKLLQMLQCNMDIQVVTSAKAIAYYIAKYISKAEPDECRPETSKAISEIQADINDSFFTKGQKIATLMLKQREVGAPEVGFRICHLPLRMSSRSFVFVPTYKPADRTRMVKRDTIGTSSEQFCLNVFDRYINRPAELQSLCLLEFVAYYKPAQRENEDENEDDDGDNIEFRDEDEEEQVRRRQPLQRLALQNGKGNIVRRQHPAIVKTPQFDPLGQKENYYYSLVILYRPFETENFLEQYPSITDAFRELQATFRSHADDPILRPELAQELQLALVQLFIPVSPRDSPDDLDNDILDNNVQNVFEDVYEPLSEHEVFQVPNVLGDIGNNSQDLPPEVILQRRFDSMNVEQRQVYFQVQTKMFSRDSPPLRLFVQGEAGCGKSYLIDNISVLIETLSRTEINGRKTIVRAAQTGVAAKNIAGVTLHKLFSLNVERNGFVPKCKKLSGQKLQERRNVLRHVEWIIIDEISMVNYQTLQNIDSRLRDIFSSEEPFAGKNVLLFGDLLQLKPVLGTWCFQQPNSLRHETDLWSLFTIYELTTVVRQRDDSLFRNVLGKLRTGDLLETDLQPLKQRVLEKSNPFYDELVRISDDSLHIYPLVKQVDLYNQEKMDELKAKGNPIYLINCIDKIADIDKHGAVAPDSYIPRDDRKCGGIPRQLQLAIGCRIMLRRNISVDAGLVNGSMGTVMRLGWAVRRDGPCSDGEQPEFIAVQFDDNVGEHLLDVDGYYRVTANSFEFEGNYRHKISRIQFPVVLCYACTVHKVQGLTLARASVYLGIEMFTAGMAYVALSRLRSLDGLVILKLHDSRLLWTKRFMKPCNMVPYTEIIRLRIQREMQNLDDKEQRELARWTVEYPICSKCKNWICMCVCKSVVS